jgi:hypothetical protein
MTSTIPSPTTLQAPDQNSPSQSASKHGEDSFTKAPFPTEKRAKKKAGRKSLYDPEFAIEICVRIASTTQPLETICQSPEMPGVATIFRWLRRHADFRVIYEMARQAQAELLIEESLAIIDDGSADLTIALNGRPVFNREALRLSKLHARQCIDAANRLRARRNRN